MIKNKKEIKKSNNLISYNNQEILYLPSVYSILYSRSNNNLCCFFEFPLWNISPYIENLYFLNING